MTEVLLDALIDTLKLMPLLLVAHVLIEVLEHAAIGKIRTEKALKGPWAPLIGSGVGLLPQCGFSVVAAKMYAGKHITLGTLFAVFVATSDEAIPILLSNPETAYKLVPLLILKFAAALVLGYGTSLILSRREKKRLTESGADEHFRVKGCHGHELGEQGEHAEHSGDSAAADGRDAVAAKKKKIGQYLDRYLWHPLLHTLTVSLYILALNVALGIIIYYVTEERLVAFMENSRLLQPLLASVVGLIPNCASSVAIAGLYARGALSLGGACAGLIVNAGLGLAVLFKENKNVKENIAVFATLLCFSVLIGTVVELVLLAV